MSMDLLKTIILDPGHGGEDPGAISPHLPRLLEKDVNLTIARACREMLHGSVRVYMTREHDSFPSLAERVVFANNKAPVDLFLSIHANSASRREASGAECWTSPGETAADPAAKVLIDHWVQDFPDYRFRREAGPSGPDKEAGLYVLRKTRCPAVLWEAGFLSNAEDSHRLNSPEWLQRAGESLAGGILAYLGETAPEPTSEPESPYPGVALSELDNAIMSLRKIQKLIRDHE